MSVARSTKGGVLYAHAPAWALGQVVARRVGLDDSTSDNGPLRVVAMRPLVVHASSKATSAAPRRVLHIEYAGAEDLGAGVPLAIG